jgi:hypothetical protein
VVPLFETLDDLTNAPETMDTLLSSDWYRNHIQVQHGGVQEVMIGEWGVCVCVCVCVCAVLCCLAGLGEW